MNFRMPAGFAAPSRTPAYSTWRKHVSSRACVVGSVLPSGIVNGGEEEYDVTIGRSPWPPPAVKSTSKASDQPAVILASLAISLVQYTGHASPYFATVASRKARPGDEVDAPGVTNSPR